MKRKNNEPRPFITEEEFNQAVIGRANSEPQTDSKGDSAIDRAVEVSVGEHFVDGQFDDIAEIEEEDLPDEMLKGDKGKLADATTDDTHAGPSTWPDLSEISEEERFDLTE